MRPFDTLAQTHGLFSHLVCESVIISSTEQENKALNQRFHENIMYAIIITDITKFTVKSCFSVHLTTKSIIHKEKQVFCNCQETKITFQRFSKNSLVQKELI